ncbi:MAG: heme-binding domain-containing protein [Bacteroidota bacterium]|nr:heme-binding domain-containing protein [Bacteroidota bacterium]
MKVKKILKISGIVAGIAFVLIQFIQPNRSNPPFDPATTMQAELKIPTNVSSLLERGCKDCHSNETRWPFYSYIAPVSWLVADDVKEGRKHMNFSEWGSYKEKKKIRVVTGIYQEVKDRTMPLPKYVPLHPDAKFTDAERDTLLHWAKSEGEKMLGGSVE